MRAGDADKDCGVEVQSGEGDFLSAVLTEAELAVLDALKGGVDAAAAGLPASLSGFRHRLSLQGIHSAEAPYGLLIELDGYAIFGSQGVFLFQCDPLLAEPVLEFLDLGNVRHGLFRPPAFFIG